MENFAIIIAVLAGLVVGFVFGKKSTTTDTSQYEIRINDLNSKIELLNSHNSDLQKKVSEQATLDATLNPLKEQVLELQRIANKSNTTRAEAEENIKTSIANIQASYGSLSTETQRLSTALTRSQDRGAWGEIQLKQILESSGLIEGVHFTSQHQFTNADGKIYKPDFTIELPGHNHIVIDSKFPFEAYWQSLAEEDQSKKDELLAKHAKDILKHAKDLHDKNYTALTNGPKYVVMWLPYESMLSAAVQSDPSLPQKCMQLNIALTTPTMFYGTTVQLSFIWQQDKLAANAAHIQKAASNLLERIVKVSGLLGKLRNGLVTSINGFNEFSSQYENSLMDDARALHELGVSVSNELSTPSPITENMRKLKGTEDIIDVEPVDELDQ